MAAIRALAITENAVYCRHLKRLSADDRRLRFGRSVSDETIAAHVERLAPWRTLVLAHVDARLEVVAAVELSFLGRGCAEVAFSVDADHRGRGLGTALMARALAVARNRGVREVHASCLGDNLAMRRLGLRAGARAWTEAGECIGVIRLSPADPGSLWAEGIGGLAGLADTAVKATLNAMTWAAGGYAPTVSA